MQLSTGAAPWLRPCWVGLAIGVALSTCLATAASVPAVPQVRANPTGKQAPMADAWIFANLPPLTGPEALAASAVVERFLGCWIAGDLEGMYDLTSSPTRHAFTLEQFQACYTVLPPGAIEGDGAALRFGPKWVLRPARLGQITLYDASREAWGRPVSLARYQARFTMRSLLGPDICDMLYPPTGYQVARARYGRMLLWNLNLAYKPLWVDPDFVACILMEAEVPEEARRRGGVGQWLQHTGPQSAVSLGMVGKPVARRALGCVNLGPLVLVHEPSGWRIVDAVQPAQARATGRGALGQELFEPGDAEPPIEPECR